MKQLTSFRESALRKVSLILLACFLLPNFSFAGGSITTRNKCRWYSKKYVAHAHVSSFLILYNQVKNDAKCEYVQVVANGNVPCSYAAAGNGPSSSWISTYTNEWYCGAGIEYERPEYAPDNPDGFSRSMFSQKVMINGANRNGIIKIKDIEGFISASVNTKFSSFYRIILWVPEDIEEKGYQDTLITPKKVLWEASVRIEDGKLITTGGFRDIDFELTYTKDSVYDEISGLYKVFFVKQLRPKHVQGNGNKITKTLAFEDVLNELIIDNPRGVPSEVINNVTLDDIAVTVIGSSGYGTFKDDLDPLYNVKSYQISTFSEKISNPSLDPYVNTFPNPITNNEFQLELFLHSDNADIEIMDISGKIIYSQLVAIKEDELNLIKINTSQIKPGIYYLRIVNNEKIIVKKIIISNN